jgi:hypothetical protein
MPDRPPEMRMFFSIILMITRIYPLFPINIMDNQTFYFFGILMLYIVHRCFSLQILYQTFSPILLNILFNYNIYRYNQK